MLTRSKVAAGIIAAAVLLAGCEEMVEDDDKVAAAPGRCDADPDWYIDKTITRINLGGDIEWPEVRDEAEDVLIAIGEEYEGQPFTTERFKKIQDALFKTGLYQEGSRKWGIETLARPDIPDSRAADPTRPANGCPGVELEMDGQMYLPQRAWERPLRIVN